MTITERATLLRLPLAADKYKIPETEIRELIEQGRLDLYELEEETGRVWLVARDEVAALAAERFIRRENFKHLEGVPISISDAGFKYHFHTGTISKWIKQNHITVLERTPNWVYINEADIAYAAALRDLKGIRPGRNLWTETGS
jgi:hypothetical protein